MYIPFFLSFLVFIAWSGYEMKKSSRIQEKKEREFWEKENRANNVRRRPTEQLNYVRINPDSFPVIYRLDVPEQDIRSLAGTLKEMEHKDILNLTGKTNTDLKLEYGPANLAFLTECDNNFTLFCRTLNRLGAALVKYHYDAEAVQVYEFAVFHESDVSATYSSLAELYQKNGCPEKIDSLIKEAEKLNSLLKPSIIRNLNQIKDSCQSFRTAK